MAHYFNTKTGELLDASQHRGVLDNLLAQSAPVVQLEGGALDVVRAGQKALGRESKPKEITSAHPRPDAEESKADAGKALKDAEKEAGEARDHNAAAAGYGGSVDPEASGNENLAGDGPPKKSSGTKDSTKDAKDSKSEQKKSSGSKRKDQEKAGAKS